MSEKNKRGLLVGRFQPFHLGHAEAVKYILRRAKELIIVIGSSQKSHTLENPFTTGERISMIRAALDEINIETSRYYLIPVPDSPVHSLWVYQVITYCPPFDIVYSNEALTRRLFKEAGRVIRSIPMHKRKIYLATEVRKRILADENWWELVPKSVIRIIEKIDGVERLKDLVLKDSLKIK